MILPNLRHLCAALEIKRLGSITRAAETVNLSQPAITQGIRNLEKTLGFKLFTRSHEGLQATEPGIIFLHRAERAVTFLYDARPLFLPSYKNNTMLMRLLTTGQLRAVMTVADRGSYTVAAKQLKVTQPTVSRAVKDVERLCRFSLFSKAESGVEASPQARRLARCISLFFTELAQGWEDVQHYSGKPTGELRIGSLPLSRTSIVPLAVISLVKVFPEANVSIIEGPYEEQLSALLQGKLDVIVGALRSPSPDSAIVQRPMFTDELSVVMKRGHRLDTAKEITTQALQQLEWVAPRKETPAREAFRGFFARFQLEEPTKIIESSSLIATRALLMSSERLALLSRRQVDIDVQYGLLSVRPQKLPGTERQIGISYRRKWQPTKIQQEFLSTLEQSFLTQ